MRVKEWRLSPRADAHYLSDMPELPPLCKQLLFNRGLRDSGEVRAFLTDSGAGEHNPSLLKGMDLALERLGRGIEAGERIAVYGDYDVDGVVATVLLVEAIEAAGGAAIPYIPHRMDEGYGLNVSALDKLSAMGVSLVVAADCGTCSVEEVGHARRLGLDVIVTDHHRPHGELAPAFALINPRQSGCPYPFKELAGAALAHKLALALTQRRGVPWDLREALALVALATVADMAPLRGENRDLVRQGLAALQRTNRPGLRALMSAAGLEPEHLSASTIGFVLAPRLNAAGRLEHALESYRLLTAREPQEALALARALSGRNAERQELVRRVSAQARARLHEVAQDPIVVLAGEGFHIGVAGLAAGRLAEEVGKPVLLVEERGEVCRGSARSVAGFDILAALHRCSDLFSKYGGHRAAAGFTLPRRNLERLKQRVCEVGLDMGLLPEAAPFLEVEAETPLAALKGDSLRFLSALEPLGMGNPQPVLLSRGVALLEWRRMGNDHLSLKLRADRVVWDAVAFGQAAREGELAERLDIVYTSDREACPSSRGAARLHILDFQPTEAAWALGAASPDVLERRIAP